MKRINKITSVGIITILLFTGCGKNDSVSGKESVVLELPGYVENEEEAEYIPVENNEENEEEEVVYEEYVPGTIYLVQETENKRKEYLNKAIDEIINCKVRKDEEGLQAKLAELSEKEPEVAQGVSNTLLYWDKVNEKDFVSYTLSDDLSGEDDLCFVVMGFMLNPNGSMKEELIDRLKLALDAAQKYPNSYILCTGGGTASANRNATEAGKMAEWLKQNGVAEERIIIEDKAQDSVDNVLNSYKKLKNGYLNVDYVVLISSDYHVPLSCLMFEARFEMACAEGYDDIHIVGNYSCKKSSGYGFSVDNEAKYLKEIIDSTY